MSLKTYYNQPITTKSDCNLNLTAKGKQHNLLFTIVPDEHESLLGDKAAESLGRVKRVYQLNADDREKEKNVRSPIVLEKIKHSQ